MQVRVWEVAEPSTGETEAGSDEDSDEGEKYDDDMLNLMRAQVNAEKKMKKLLALKIKQEEEEWRTSVYTLTSVGGKGEAELIRLLFVIANQPFKDERITKEEWEEMKPTTPYQTLPILSRCGRQWGEAGAIVRMLARKFLLLGVINDEHLIVEATYERLRRLKHQNNRAISWVISGEKNREKLEWAQGQLLHVILPPALKEWDQLLQKTRGPFIAASGMTMADIAIVDFLDQCSSHLMIDSLLSDFMAVSDLLTVIKACPSLRKYGDERPED
ncbi:glutathione S-transferase 3-like [Physella acuta]|uniref:glutathione S-transferase 3-like n=1 Tax=Physella acuta TaxID=109671 RepID=UPI0027DBBD70|nr:glutathione S-transferase 3-like [Physella acuta]